MEKPSLKEVNQAAFVFEEAPDYRVTFCSGFWGGVTPAGLIQANVFQDTIVTPLSMRFTRTEDGMNDAEVVQPSTSIDDAANYRRRFLMGLIVKPEDAVSMAQWLLNVSDQLMNVTGVSAEFSLENGQVVQLGIPTVVRND